MPEMETTARDKLNDLADWISAAVFVEDGEYPPSSQPGLDICDELGRDIDTLTQQLAEAERVKVEARRLVIEAQTQRDTLIGGVVLTGRRDALAARLREAEAFIQETADGAWVVDETAQDAAKRWLTQRQEAPR